MLNNILVQGRAQERETGASLVTTLLLLLSLSVLGLAALSASRTDTQLVANDNLHKQLFIAAEAGLEMRPCRRRQADSAYLRLRSSWLSPGPARPASSFERAGS